MFYQHMLHALLALFLTADYVKLTLSKEVRCLVPIFSNTAWTDRRPDFNVNMTFGEQGYITSLTTVTREIANPISRLRIDVADGNNKVQTLYNMTARLCDIDAMMSKIPMMKQAYQTAIKQGNYSMDCPMKPGTYVMGNLRIANRSPVLTLLGRRGSFVISGGMYEEMENKTLLPLTTYKFTLKIVKKSCKE